MAERREFYRLNTDISANLYIDNKEVACRICDISERGICFEVDMKTTAIPILDIVRKGELIECQFFEDSESDDVITIKVVYMDGRVKDEKIYLGCRANSILYERFVIRKKAQANKEL